MAETVGNIRAVCLACIQDNHDLCIDLYVKERQCKCRTCIQDIEPVVLILSIEVSYEYSDFAENVLHLLPYESIDLDDALVKNAIQRVFLEDLRQQLEDNSYDVTSVGVEIVSAAEDDEEVQAPADH